MIHGKSVCCIGVYKASSTCTSRENFENGVFRPEGQLLKCKNVIFGHFEFVRFEENLGREVAWWPCNHRFRNVFRPHLFEKMAFSNFSGLTSVFYKFCFRDGLIRVDGRPNPKNKDAFWNSSGVVWTRLKSISVVNIKKQELITRSLQVP